MNTMTKTAADYSATGVESKIETILQVINTHASVKGYRLYHGKTEVEEVKSPSGMLAIFTGSKLVAKISEQSLNGRKRLVKSATKIEKHTSTVSINKFLKQYSRLVETPETYSIKVSEKEEQIQTARKEWTTLRDQAEAALLKYKETKGDFYKVK